VLAAGALAWLMPQSMAQLSQVIGDNNINAGPCGAVAADGNQGKPAVSPLRADAITGKLGRCAGDLGDHIMQPSRFAGHGVSSRGSDSRRNRNMMPLAMMTMSSG